MRYQELLEGKTSGTFMGMNPTDECNDKIVEWCKKNKIENVHDDFHTTIIIDKEKTFSEAPESYDPALKIKAKDCEYKLFGEDNNVLVVAFAEPALSKRHTEIKDKNDIKYDFPEYIPHLSLSYDFSGDVEDLPEWNLDLEFADEFIRPFNSDWSPKPLKEEIKFTKKKGSLFRAMSKQIDNTSIKDLLEWAPNNAYSNMLSESEKRLIDIQINEIFQNEYAEINNWIDDYRDDYGILRNVIKGSHPSVVITATSDGIAIDPGYYDIDLDGIAPDHNAPLPNIAILLFNNEQNAENFVLDFKLTFDNVTVIMEDGLIVPGVNTTVDVKQGETQRQAAKFGNKLDKDGNPPSMWDSAKLAAKITK